MPKIYVNDSQFLVLTGGKRFCSVPSTRCTVADKIKEARQGWRRLFYTQDLSKGIYKTDKKGPDIGYLSGYGRSSDIGFMLITTQRCG